MKFSNTLGNTLWLGQNENKLKEMLPSQWTHVDNLNGLQIGWKMKLLGLDWRSEQEFGKIMVFLEKVGILQRQNGLQVRANPVNIFQVQ